jgi:hydrogenase maturation factor
LAAVNPEGKTKVETTLRQNGIEASIIGVFTKNKRRILMLDDQETPFPREADDPYTRILSGLV